MLTSALLLSSCIVVFSRGSSCPARDASNAAATGDADFTGMNLHLLQTGFYTQSDAAALKSRREYIDDSTVADSEFVLPELDNSKLLSELDAALELDRKIKSEMANSKMHGAGTGLHERSSPISSSPRGGLPNQGYSHTFQFNPLAAHRSFSSQNIFDDASSAKHGHRNSLDFGLLHRNSLNGESSTASVGRGLEAQPAAFFEAADLDGSADSRAGGLEAAVEYQLQELKELPTWTIFLVVTVSIAFCCSTMCYCVCGVDTPDEREFWYNIFLAIFVPGTRCDLYIQETPEETPQQVAERLKKKKKSKEEEDVEAIQAARAKMQARKEEREQKIAAKKGKEKKPRLMSLPTPAADKVEEPADTPGGHELWCLPPVPLLCWNDKCICYVDRFSPKRCMLNYGILAFIAGGSLIMWKTGVLEPVLNEMATYIFIMISMALILAVIIMEISSQLHDRFYKPVHKVIENIQQGLAPVEETVDEFAEYVDTMQDQLESNRAIKKMLDFLGINNVDELDNATEEQKDSIRKKAGCC
jgi:hypothetical protein